MNLVRIGTESLNLSLVMRFKEMAADGEHEERHIRRIELTFVNGTTMALEGAEAEALRRYLTVNSAELWADAGGPDFADGGDLLPKAHRGEERA